MRCGRTNGKRKHGDEPEEEVDVSGLTHPDALGG